MSLDASTVLETVTHELNMPQDELLKQGLRSLLERRPTAAKAEAFAIHGKYGVSSVEEMEARYRDGAIAEAISRRDMQRLDRLEYKAGRMQQLLRDLG